MHSPIKISHYFLIFNHGYEFTQLTSDFFEQSKGKQPTCSEDQLYNQSILYQPCITRLQCGRDGWAIRLVLNFKSVVILHFHDGGPNEAELTSHPALSSDHWSLLFVTTERCYTQRRKQHTTTLTTDDRAD